MRLLWLFLFLALIVLLPFAIWGDGLEAAFSLEGTVGWLRGHGRWAWAAGLGLLAADLVLPIPGTAVMSALGFLYGVAGGGLLAAGGSVLSGLIGYGLCRLFGERAVEWLLGAKDRERGERWFREGGGWVVALSRWLPVMPEVVACMAGLLRMPFGRFFAALLCGSVPLGFVFAWVGQAGQANPLLAIAISACLPPLLWVVVRRWVGREGAAKRQRDKGAEGAARD